jgi:hypothetical protein
MAAAGEKTPASQAILTQLQTITKLLTEMQSDGKVQTSEILGKLNEVLTRQSTAVPRARNATGAKPAAAGPQKKFHPSSLYYFKALWKEDRAGTIKRFGITDKMVKDVEKQFNDDEKTKSKVGDAKLAAEANIFWTTYSKGRQNEEMNKKIKSAYESAREAFEKENKTPAKADADASAAGGDDAADAGGAAGDDDGAAE